MTRKNFMNKLMEYLKNISKEEREDIEKFYNEMFDEENISLNDEVPNTYENPKKIAFDILGDNFESENKKQRKKEKILTINFKSLFGFLSRISVFVPIISVLGVLFGILTISLILTIIIFPIGLLFFSSLYIELLLIIASLFLVSLLILMILSSIYKYYRIKNKRKNSFYNSEYYSKNRGFKIDLEYSDLFDEYEEVEEGEDDMKNETEKDFENIHYFENVEKLFVETNILNLEILESEDDRVVVDKTDLIEKKEVKVNFKNGTLSVKNNINEDKKRNLKIGVLDLDKLKIYVPKNIILDFNINAGKCTISDIEFKNSKIELNAGTLEFSDSFGENLTAELNAGTMKISDLKVEKLNSFVNAGKMEIFDTESTNMKMQVNAGNALLQDNSFNFGEINVNMGSLKGEVSFEEFLDIVVNMGSLNLKLENKNDIKYYLEKSIGSFNISRDFARVYNKKDANLSVEVEMGSAKIR